MQNYTIFAAAFIFMLASIYFYVFFHAKSPSNPPYQTIENFGAQFKEYKIFSPAKDVKSLMIYDMSNESHNWSSVMTRDWQLVNIWATWCPPCIVEIPSLLAVREQFEDDRRFDIHFLSIDFPENASQLADKMSQKGMDFNVLSNDGYYTKDIDIWNALGIDGVPTTFLVDGYGRIHAAFMGDIDWNQKETLEFISVLINHSE